MKFINKDADRYPYPQSSSIPEILFFIFQAKFAGIILTLIGGAMPERMKFHNILIFMSIWVIFLNCVMTHWIENNEGWLYVYLM